MLILRYLAISLASALVPASGSWAMKQQLKSPGYTCRWAELPPVR